MNVIFKRPFNIKVDPNPKAKPVTFKKSSIPQVLPDHCADDWFVKAAIEEGDIVILPAPKKVDLEALAAAKAKALAKQKAEADAKAKADEEAALQAELEAEAAAKAKADAKKQSRTA